MPDYQKSKIYKLTCDDPNLIYYGATTKKYLCDRLAHHKNKHLKTCECLFEAGNVKIELVENYPCNDKNELNARESFYIRNNNCVNKQIPDRTMTEYNHTYYQENREKINERKKVKIICECGLELNKANLTKHRKSAKHIKWANSQS